MNYYTILQSLPELSREELQRLIKAVHIEEEHSKKREMINQLNLLEEDAFPLGAAVHAQAVEDFLLR